MLSSYLVTQVIVKAKKPHTIAEELIMTCVLDIVKEMYVSSDAVNQRIGRNYFVIQMDESTDIANKSHLIVY